VDLKAFLLYAEGKAFEGSCDCPKKANAPGIVNTLHPSHGTKVRASIDKIPPHSCGKGQGYQAFDKTVSVRHDDEKSFHALVCVGQPQQYGKARICLTTTVTRTPSTTHWCSARIKWKHGTSEGTCVHMWSLHTLSVCVLLCVLLHCEDFERMMHRQTERMTCKQTC